jgi:hypothetical protein
MRTRAVLLLDAVYGWQSAAVLWCAPVAYRDPSCISQPDASINRTGLYGGCPCAPREDVTLDSRPDWADYVTFVADYLGNSSATGYFQQARHRQAYRAGQDVAEVKANSANG